MTVRERRGVCGTVQSFATRGFFALRQQVADCESVGYNGGGGVSVLGSDG